MATYSWSVPNGNIITGSTYIKDTDNKIQDTMNDLADFVNSSGAYTGQGLLFDYVNKASNQTITGIKTFSNGLIGNVNGNITGNADTATKLATARTITLAGDATGSVSFDGSANVNITATVNYATSSGTATNATNVSGGRALVQGTGNDYHLGGVEVLGNGGANTVFPTIGFHQGGIYASSLQLRAGGDFRFYSQGAVSYANVTANAFIGNLSGNSATATKLQTPRKINGVNFDGSADINTFQTGMIMLWSGSQASIPSGWLLCNGSNGTPNLMDRFVIGAGNNYAVGATGGSKDATLVSHTHTATSTAAGAHSHNYTRTDYSTSATDYQFSGSYSLSQTTQATSAVGDHNHTISINTVGSSATNANLPPYYALCFIMKA